ncbi:hypothetical protein Tco_1210618 [Tanacetum coccineum]
MEYCENEDDSFTNLETEYPAIVFDDTSDTALLCEPTVSPLDNNEIDFKISFDESDDEDYMVIFDKKSFSYQIIFVNNLKIDSKDENDKVNMPSSLSPEPTFGYFYDLHFFKDFKNEFSAIVYNDLKSKSDPLIEPSVNMAPLPHRDLRYPWLRYQVEGYDEGIVRTYEYRLEMIFGREVNPVHVLDFAGLTGALHSEEEMAEAGFGAYWSGSKRVIPDKGDLRDYWIGISSDKDFLGPAPSYVHIRDPVRRLCHRMIACSIFGRGQGAEKYLFRHTKGRKSGARLSGGHFIGHFAAHFGLVSDEGLRGLSIIARELPVIDLHELAVVAGAPGAAEDAPVVDVGAEAVPAPV